MAVFRIVMNSRDAGGKLNPTRRSSFVQHHSFIDALSLPFSGIIFSAAFYETTLFAGVVRLFLQQVVYFVMRRVWFVRLGLSLAAVAVPCAVAQSSSRFMPLDSGFGPLDSAKPSVPVKQIISDFVAKETEFAEALENYTWIRTVKVEVLNSDDKPKGEYFERDAIERNKDDKKVVHVLYAPPSTLGNGNVYMSESDFQDIDHRLPFVLTEDKIGEYNVTYVGRQKVDQVETYVFEVAPKKIKKHHRYFDGRIWVDQRDHQIVVTDGKSVPDDLKRGQEDLSLPFITFRQQIDGKYWFPVWTHGEGWLHFEGGDGYMSENVHMNELVTYTNYKRFGSKVTLLFNGKKLKKPGKTEQKGTEKEPQKPQ